MTWLSSIFIACLSGVLGLFCAGGIASLCVDWYRVSSFEGKSGFFVVFTALLGGLAAGVIGLIAARVVAAGVAPGLLRGLGMAGGSVLGIALVALLLCRWFADIAPTMDGKSLELEIEVRCPKGFTLPAPDDYGATAEVYLPGGRRQPSEKLRVKDARTVEGQLIVPATVPLDTSATTKYLRARFDAQHSLLFSLPLRSHPRPDDSEWSKWLESGWDTNQPEPPKEARFHLRYRVRTVEPPPPEPTEEEVIAAKFAALPADAPLAEWLRFLFESPNAERTRIVTEHLNTRQIELCELFRDEQEEMRERAFEAVAYVAQPAPELKDALLAAGHDIAEAIRRFNALPPTDPGYPTAPVELRSRFNYWKRAWWTVSQRLDLDARPPVQEIHDLATVRATGTGMDEIVLNARAILDALKQKPREKQP